tara:strand:+ start:183 stop:503 length:321 start_codon:yes stop_codon:yes gene_type:complete
MSKIKKVDEITDLSVYTKFTKDEGMFQIEARVYSMVSEVPGIGKKYGHDISEIELGFFINDKKVQYTGFKTLYEQLFGKDTFGDFYYKKSQEFEAAYLKTTPYKTK